jgi:hypothetical protein
LKYKVNWIKGNIKLGGTLTVKVSDAYTIAGFVKQRWKGLFWRLKQVDQGKNSLSFKLKERKRGKLTSYPKGKYQLRVSAYDKRNRQQIWTEEFEIV